MRTRKRTEQSDEDRRGREKGIRGMLIEELHTLTDRKQETVAALFAKYDSALVE